MAVITRKANLFFLLLKSDDNNLLKIYINHKFIAQKNKSTKQKVACFFLSHKLKFFFF